MEMQPANLASPLVIADRFELDRRALESLLTEFHVRTLSLFGSAARGEMSENSDVDLLVEFEPGMKPSLGGLVELRDSLSQLLGGVPVDLVTPSILENPFRRRAICQDLKLLHAA